MILAILIIGLILTLIVFALCRVRQNKRFILSRFRDGNIIVSGKKGKGKDLFFNYVINSRKKKCRANIQYNPDICEKTDLNYLTLTDPKRDGEQLTYSDFLSGKFRPVEKKLDENVDYYISDAGVFLPSQSQAELCKKYPSLPITYALSRHLAKMNIHCNTQNLNRVWDKLREQADGFFTIRKSLIIGKIVLQKVTFYDDYNSAIRNLREYKNNKLLSSKENKALYEQFCAMYGNIINMWVIHSTNNIKYDTREFHKQIYGESAPV